MKIMRRFKTFFNLIILVTIAFGGIKLYDSYNSYVYANRDDKRYA